MFKNKFVYLVFISLLLSISLVSAGPAGFGKVKIQSTYPGFNSPDGVWVFDWIDTGYQTDKVRALFEPSDIEDDTGIKTKGDFDISIDGTDNYCKYDIRRDTDRLDIFRIDIINDTSETYWAWEYTDSELEQIGFEMMQGLGCLQMSDYAGGYPGHILIIRIKILGVIVKERVKVYCFKERSSDGKIGTIRNLKYVTETDWRIEAEGKTPITKSISNDACSEEKEFCEGLTTDLSSDVKIQWEGQLSSGDTCPIATEELMLHDGNTWKVIGKLNYINYEGYMRSDLTEAATFVACYEISGYDCPGISRSNQEQIINAKAVTAATEQTFADFDVDIISSSLSAGVLKIQLENLIRFPLFRLFVDSDYLELLITVGAPKITCPSEVIEFNSGEVGKITVQAENDGDSEGGFNIRIKECTAGFGAGDTFGLTLDSQESQEVTLSTTSSVPEETLTGSCTIEMKESFTNEVAICNVNLKSFPLAICTEGNKWCDYDAGGKSIVMECKDGKKELLEECNLNCDYDQDGVPFCVVSPTPGIDELARQKGIMRSEVKTATTITLMQSICTNTLQCEAESECMSLQSLVTEGTITDIKARSIANTMSDQFSTISGWGVGIGATAVCTAFTGLFPICGVVGLGLGLGIDSLFDSIAEKNLEEVGLCIKEGEGICGFLEPLAFFKITGDKCVDGGIIIGGGILLLLLVFSQMGGKK